VIFNEKAPENDRFGPDWIITLKKYKSDNDNKWHLENARYIGKAL
jgi:hypothetical protein